MEITRLNIISDFVSPLPKVPQVYNSFWKWCAITLALIATFTSIFARIKHLIIRLRTIKPSASSKHLLHLLDDSFDFTDDDSFDFTDDDSDSSSPDQQSDDDEDSIFDTTLFDNQTTNKFSDQDFRVAGSNLFSGDLFSWSDFAAGKNVVKLWENIGLGLDLQDSFLSEYSTWGFEKDCKGSCLSGDNRQNMSSPAVVYVAEKSSNNDGVSFGVYDKRMGSKNPAVYAEWAQPMGKVVGVGGGGVEKVYVKGGGAAAALTVGDLRNVRTPLERLTEADVGTWWDVINHDEF